MSRFPDANEISEKLASRAEAVCHTYLPNGRKDGNYWMIGNAMGEPGRSMYVRLRGPLSGRGAVGRWTDAATGDHGDLLDIIRLACGLNEFRDVLEEACRFLSLPDIAPVVPQGRRGGDQGISEGSGAAGRLYASSRPLAGSLAETYLNSRGIALQADLGALRFHPRCFYGVEAASKTFHWPGLIAAVTDLNGNLTGVSRTFLRRDGLGKAPVESPRRSKGELLGHGTRFGATIDVQAVGEGLETTLSLRAAVPHIPLVSATGANHLSALLFPVSLRTLLVIRDNDHAGDTATDALFS